MQRALTPTTRLAIELALLAAAPLDPVPMVVFLLLPTLAGSSAARCHHTAFDTHYTFGYSLTI